MHKLLYFDKKMTVYVFIFLLLQTMEETAKKLLILREIPEDDLKVKTFCVPYLTAAELEQILGQACNGIVSKVIVIYNTIDIQSKRVAFLKTLCDFDIFEHDRLALLLRGHRLVPPHFKLSQEEKEQVMLTYGVLPSICLSDPIVQLYGFKKGDVIKIKRKSGTIYYRRVIDD